MITCWRTQLLPYQSPIRLRRDAEGHNHATLNRAALWAFSRWNSGYYDAKAVGTWRHAP